MPVDLTQASHNCRGLRFHRPFIRQPSEGTRNQIWYLDHIVNRHPFGSGVCLPIPRLNRLVMIVMGNSRAAVQH